MTAAHEVSAARELIGIAEKRQQYFEICEYRLNTPFLERKKKEDFALLQRSEVSHVATINVTHGDEPTRWRIRRLYNKIRESGESMGNENEAFKKTLYILHVKLSPESN